MTMTSQRSLTDAVKDPSAALLSEEAPAHG